MCLFPKLIRNPTKRFNVNGGQPLLLYVPCGKCAECADKKRKEWKFRSFHETANVLKHGYVVYDTLTYSDKYLPHISDFVDIKKHSIADFSCFNANHWRGFLKRLRRHLEYHYNIVNLRYFLVSEYGMDDNYTHRPHYHVLFFIPTKRLSPVKFSRIVSSLWTYGRTDGIQYNKFHDFKEKVFGYNFGDGENRDLLKVCGYISKYITKDSTFQPTLDKRLKLCEDAFCNDEDSLKVCKSCINQYHRQSQGFGLSFLDTLDSYSYSDIMDKGVVRVYDEDKVIATLPCPMYYKRKLFYKLHKFEDKTYTWLPTTKGREFVEKTLIRNVDNTYNRLYNSFINLREETQNLIINLLNKRNLYDISIYYSIYRNRMLPHSYFGKVDPSSHIDENTEMLRLDVSSSYAHICEDEFSILRDIDTDLVHLPFALPDLFGSVKTKAISISSFIQNYTITQNSLPRFKHFDDIINILETQQNQNNVGKQKCFDYYEVLIKKFNIFYGK